MGNCKANKALFTLQENDLSTDLGKRLVTVVRHKKFGYYEYKVLNRQEMEPLIQLLYSISYICRDPDIVRSLYHFL